MQVGVVTRMHHSPMFFFLVFAEDHSPMFTIILLFFNGLMILEKIKVIKSMLPLVSFTVVFSFFY